MRLVRFFCSVMEDDLLVSSFPRTTSWRRLPDWARNGESLLRWIRAATSGGRMPPSYLRCFIYLSSEFQYPISRILNQACSISNNLLSFILFASDRTESSTSPPGAWALDCQLPHRWDIFMFQQLFRFCELTMTLRRLDLRDAGDYDPRQRIHRCADIGHQLLHLPPLLFILLFFLLQGELSGTLGWASPAYLSHVTQLP